MRLLDTNVCIDVLRGRPDVVPRLERHGPAGLFLCSIVKAELLYGARLATDPQRAHDLAHTFFAPFVSLAFDDACLEAYVRLRIEARTAGTTLGANDLVIASTAVAHDLTLVSADLAAFDGMGGLRVETWRQQG